MSSLSLLLMHVNLNGTSSCTEMALNTFEETGKKTTKFGYHCILFTFLHCTYTIVVILCLLSSLVASGAQRLSPRQHYATHHVLSGHSLTYTTVQGI